jgi:hypothetical protein
MKIFRKVAKIAIMLAMIVLLPATTALANLGVATVDGDISDWNLASDYFASMYRAGDSTKEHESDLYLRYDCDNQILYVLVLQANGVPLQIISGTAWIAIDSQSNKLVTDGSGNDGTPPDFAWVGQGYDGDPTHAQGYEASFELAPGTYEIIAHVDVYDSDNTQTSATDGFPSDGPTLDISCDPTAVTITSLTAHSAGALPLALAVGGLGILTGLGVIWRRQR